VASSRQRLAGALLLVLATAFSVSLAMAIPRLYAAAYQWALHYVGDRPVAGFHDGPIALGALHGLLQSEEVVARVEGDAGDHLRGNAYVLYQRGRWLPDRPGDPRRVDTRSAAGPAPEDLRASIRFAKQDLDRFFLPALPGALQLSPARVRVDELGIARAVGDDAPTLVRLLGGRERAFPVRPPSAGDLALPTEIGVPLMELAASWVSGASSDSERIAALQARLESGFVYTLDAPADLSGDDATRDPLLVFLQETRAGHCEYFASAMTLLARASGVPARLVTGYRIAEWNGFGDYGIVRERHAHAWTEVHLANRGWVAVDPSPLRGSESAEAEVTPMWAGLIDYAKVGLDEWGTELLLVVLVVVLAGVQIRRLLVGRADTQSSEAAQVNAVPAYLDALLAALAESGAARRASETLESFAERAEREHRPARSGPDVRAQESARLLRRCAALRYGDQGDDNTLRHDIERFLTPS
jgi:transglutaminase-like putative cysteine protease